MKNSNLVMGALLVAITAVSPAAAVKKYKIVDLGIAPGGSSSTARAISSNGQIAGETNLSTSGTANIGTAYNGGVVVLPNLAGAEDTTIRGVNNAGLAAATVQGLGVDDRAALLGAGGATQLGGVAGFAAAGALDVNNSNVAAGYALNTGANFGVQGSTPVVNNGQGLQKAAIWNGGVGTLLANPTGAVNSVAVAINDNGDVAGIFRLANNRTQGVVWNGGVATTLALPIGQFIARTRAISENGWVAGQTTGSLGTLGTIWSPTSTFVLPFVVGSADSVSTTRGINNAGTVVGFSQGFDVDGNQTSQSAVLWELNSGVYTAFDISSLLINGAGWSFLQGAPQAINDRGDIVGFAVNPLGETHAYLLTTVPEPASWALMIGGFGLVGSALRRRRAVFA